MRTRSTLTVTTIAVTTITLAAALTGCAGDTATPGSGTTPQTIAASSAPAEALTVKDPWVKATTKGMMTAAFGVLVNDTAADVTITGAESAASPMELHEMSMKGGKMVMQPKKGGFVVKAKSTHELKPGGDHLMLMKPAEAIEAGDELQFTLKLADGKAVTFKAIAKPFAGAGESYDPGMSAMPMGTPSP